MQHSNMPQLERRQTKRGQEFRLRCKCGAVTNWHDKLYKAKMALGDIHEQHFHPDFKGGLQ